MNWSDEHLLRTHVLSRVCYNMNFDITQTWALILNMLLTNYGTLGLLLYFLWASFSFIGNRDNNETFSILPHIQYGFHFVPISSRTLSDHLILTTHK